MATAQSWMDAQAAYLASGAVARVPLGAVAQPAVPEGHPLATQHEQWQGLPWSRPLATSELADFKRLLAVQQVEAEKRGSALYDPKKAVALAGAKTGSTAVVSTLTPEQWQALYRARQTK